jgi:apolipoprotein N-acyltransferase
LLEAFYFDFSGKPLGLSPTDGPASAPMQRVNTALAAFIEHPDPHRFRRSGAAMRQQQDELFRLSSRAAQQGAEVVVWSEANALLLKNDEPALIRRGQQLAALQGIWLCMPLGVIIPGTLTAQRYFLENKVIIIRPDGAIATTFYKNHPVPMAESSRPGDGIVPVLETPFGRLAASICYDADHISTMRQLGEQQAGLLVLPSGDWRSIAPYHSYMARFRAIENGCSLARPVSGGLSIFTDSRGRVLASRDAFIPGPNLTVIDLPVSSEQTLYNRLGDWLVYLSLAVLLFSGLRLLYSRFLRRGIP